MQVLWMLLASFFFATMGAGLKIASDSLNVGELVFSRGLISTIISIAVMRLAGVPLRTPVPGMQLWRTVVGTFSLGTWFYAIAKLPLATAMTLNYMSGVWIAVFVVMGALAHGLSREAQRQGPLVVTVLAAFGGVALLLKPTLGQDQLFAGLVGLVSGMTAAMAYLQVTALARAGEPASRTVLYFAIGTMVAGALTLLVTGLTPWEQVRPEAWAWLVPIAVLASLGQWCMTKAYAGGPTLVAANLQYSGIVFSALYGLLWFGDRIPLTGWLGMALIIASGIAATVLRGRSQAGAPDSRPN